MIRTAFALLFVVASSSFAHANLPTDAQVSSAGKATTIADCDTSGSAPCQPRLVTRGHADLAPRFIAQPGPATAATA